MALDSSNQGAGWLSSHDSQEVDEQDCEDDGWGAPGAVELD